MLFAASALWQHQAVANAIPGNPAATVVPAADWLGPSPAPFGTKGAGFVSNLAVGTPWATNTGKWLRRTLTVDGQAGVVLRGQAENACLFFLDGAFIGAVNLSGANLAAPRTFQLPIRKALLSEGNHTLAVLCVDEAGGADGTTWFWAEADYMPAVMSLWPSPGFNESVAWLNDVQIFEDGTEEREQLRVSPRHSYRLSAFVPAADQPSLRHALWGARAAQWIVPKWPQVQHVGAVLAGATQLDLDTRYSEYAGGGLLVLWQSPSKWQVLGVDAVTSANQLALTCLTEAFTDAWVMPAHRGRLENDPQRAFDGRTSRLTATFQLEENRALTVPAPPQYLGHDVYYDPGLLDGDRTNEATVREVDLHDEQLGLVDYRSPWKHSRVSRTHRMLADGPAEAWQVRQWLHRRAGRLTPFWQPSFELDLPPVTTGNINVVLRVTENSYKRFASDRVHIAIETATGWHLREVLFTLNNESGAIDLRLDTALDEPGTTIKRVCYLALRRLNADRVELSYPGGLACSCSVPVIDVAP